MTRVGFGLWLECIVWLGSGSVLEIGRDRMEYYVEVVCFRIVCVCLEWGAVV